METGINNKCKAFTSLEQSRKLAEILPLESADMEYLAIKENGALVGNVPFVKDDSEVDDSAYNQIYDRIACWSLAALIDILPEDIIGQRHYFFEISKMGDASTPHEVRYYRFRDESDGGDFGRITWISRQANNLVDACVEMILKLHELKML
jgi:hypothetical protein